MYDIICNMIDLSYACDDYEMMEEIYALLVKLATTANCPSDWREIGQRCAEKYRECGELYDCLCLYNFED